MLMMNIIPLILKKWMSMRNVGRKNLKEKPIKLRGINKGMTRKDELWEQVKK